jgi:hypothetical protein
MSDEKLRTKKSECGARFPSASLGLFPAYGPFPLRKVGCACTKLRELPLPVLPPQGGKGPIKNGGEGTHEGVPVTKEKSMRSRASWVTGSFVCLLATTFCACRNAGDGAHSSGRAACLPVQGLTASACWQQVAPLGSGGFPPEAGSDDAPKWEPGRWPLTLIVIGFGNALWMMSQTHAWSSSDGPNWTHYRKADWGTYQPGVCLLRQSAVDVRRPAIRRSRSVERCLVIGRRVAWHRPAPPNGRRERDNGRNLGDRL